jgi:hypothetical protein
LTENHTPEFALRIRIRSLPESGELEQFDLRRFRSGQIYAVPTQLASLLIIAGYAEIVDGPPVQAEAADFGQPRFPKRT